MGARIYKVNVEHTTYGLNWTSYNVIAKTCKEAILRAEKRFLSTRERVESVELLVSES